jgi:hypothetical protein
LQAVVRTLDGLLQFRRFDRAFFCPIACFSVSMLCWSQGSTIRLLDPQIA